MVSRETPVMPQLVIRFRVMDMGGAPHPPPERPGLTLFATQDFRASFVGQQSTPFPFRAPGGLPEPRAEFPQTCQGGFHPGEALAGVAVLASPGEHLDADQSGKNHQVDSGKKGR